MRFSTKSRYGLRVMIELGLGHGQGLTQLKSIAENEEISEKYLEQIIIALRAAGLVKSVRGAKGGYFLSREPKAITVREIIEKLEGSLYPVDCGENGNNCSRFERCVSVDIWKMLGEKIYDTLEGISLASLVEKYKEKNPGFQEAKSATNKG